MCDETGTIRGYIGVKEPIRYTPTRRVGVRTLDTPVLVCIIPLSRLLKEVLSSDWSTSNLPERIVSTTSSVIPPLFSVVP